MDEAVVGFLGVTGVLLAWLGPAIVSFAKGHILGGVLGIVGFTPISWVTSLMLAKPGSGWAQRFYGPEKMARARKRYPADPEPTPPPPSLRTSPSTGSSPYLPTTGAA